MPLVAGAHGLQDRGVGKNVERQKAQQGAFAGARMRRDHGMRLGGKELIQRRADGLEGGVVETRWGLLARG